MQSPLGRYAPIVAALGSLAVLFLAGIIHLLSSLGLATTDSFIDNLAILGFGVIVGQIGAHTEAVQTAANKINGLEARVAENTVRANKADLPPASPAEVAAMTASHDG
jgi:hypothetical protein